MECFHLLCQSISPFLQGKTRYWQKALSSCLASSTVPNFEWLHKNGDSACQLDVVKVPCGAGLRLTGERARPGAVQEFWLMRACAAGWQPSARERPPASQVSFFPSINFTRPRNPAAPLIVTHSTNGVLGPFELSYICKGR